MVKRFIKIQILSDLHLEHSTIDLPATDADVVVLAGDIDKSDRGAFWAVNFPQDVIYVPGNHEYYGYDMAILDRHFKTASTETSKVHMLQNTEWFYRVDGNPLVRFLGVTLWIDFEFFGAENSHQAMRDAGMYLRDFQKIRFNGGTFTPLDSRALFFKSCDWLKAKLDKKINGPTVVVTHHAPSILSIDEYWLRRNIKLVSAAFASNLEHLIPKADLWIHDHTHDSAGHLSAAQLSFRR